MKMFESPVLRGAVIGAVVMVDIVVASVLCALHVCVMLTLSRLDLPIPIAIGLAAAHNTVLIGVWVWYLIRSRN